MDASIPIAAAMALLLIGAAAGSVIAHAVPIRLTPEPDDEHPETIEQRARKVQ